VARRLLAGSWPRPRPPARLNPTAVVALLILGAGAWRGLDGVHWSDWTVEASPSVNALLSGHIGDFFRLAPAYGGSLLLRAPFMALSRLWGGGGTAVYRMGAAPCLAALGALALWIDADMRRRACRLPARMAAVVVCTAAPLSIVALQNGHPEEILGAVLCVAAVLCAQRDRAIWSGVLVGLAIANKEWGVLAAGPVLVALQHGRWRAIASMTTTAGLLFAPFVLIHAGGFVGQTEAVAVHAGGLFSPFQLWWSLGSPIGAGARIGPTWLAGLGHTLPIAIAVALTIAYALRTRHTPDRRRHDAMLLLALLLLLRCVLDPWDAVYYPVPFLTAVLAWDASAFDGPPVRAAIASLVGWFVCEGAVASFGGNQNMLATAFAIAVLPAIGAMGLRLLRTPASRTRVAPDLGRPRPIALRRG
ncbi:MAG TPA: glycosyltransferase family 87 protein, partial [Solirubrobacteraceae bacterium]